MKNEQISNRDQNLLVAKKIAEQILDKNELYDVEKFHQSTTWQVPYKWTFSSATLKWESLIEYTDSLPDNPLKMIDMSPTYKIPKYVQPQSTRSFNKDKIISQQVIADILGKSFGRYKGIGSKQYGSAGGLYPVVPLIIILSNNAIQNVMRGVYVYDSKNYNLQLIKKISSKEDFEGISLNANSAFPGNVLSNIIFAYAIDINKAILKYGRRGYRHALIELGLISESLHLTHLSYSDQFGDCIWSGFNDNALTHACGLNIRLMPITLIQWFGFRSEVR